jgi:DNA-binding LacI/PurR family transcriptional regulator
MGHSRIAFVDFKRCKEYLSFISDIREIFKNMLKNNFKEKLFYTNSTATDFLQMHGDNYLEVYAHLALKSILSCNERPSVIVGPDSLILAIEKELKKLKIKIPDDISLCCSSYAESKRVDNICGVRHNETKLLKWALNNVIDQIEGRQKKVQTYWQKAVWHTGNSCFNYCIRDGPLKLP